MTKLQVTEVYQSRINNQISNGNGSGAILLIRQWIDKANPMKWELSVFMEAIDKITLRQLEY